MSYAQRLAEEVARAKADGRLVFASNPLDIQRFCIYWLLDELDKIELRISRAEGKVAMLAGDEK